MTIINDNAGIIATLALIVALGVAIFDFSSSGVQVDDRVGGVSNLDSLTLSEGLSVGTSSDSTSGNVIKFGADDATTTILMGRLCLGVRVQNGAQDGPNTRYLYYWPATTTADATSAATGGWATSTRPCT